MKFKYRVGKRTEEPCYHYEDSGFFGRVFTKATFNDVGRHGQSSEFVESIENILARAIQIVFLSMVIPLGFALVVMIFAYIIQLYSAALSYIFYLT